VKKNSSLLRRHLEALRFVVAVLLPAILRFRKRPVIFSRYAGIGDILCSFPAVLPLIQRHPGRVHIFNCHAEFKCLPPMAGLQVQVTSTPYLEIVHHWYGWMMGPYYPFEYIDRLPGVNSTEILIREFARPYEISVDDDHPRLTNDPAALRSMQSFLANHDIGSAKSRQKALIVIHPGPSWPIREWPRQNWIHLVAALRENGFEKIFQLGTNSHQSLTEAKAPEIPGTISLVDQLTLPETIAIISQADLFIGIDSGLLHIAASMQIPSVSLWGPTAPLLRFSPRKTRLFLASSAPCLACHHRQPRLHWIDGCPHDILCMKNIQVETVLQACLQALQRGKP